MVSIKTYTTHNSNYKLSHNRLSFLYKKAKKGNDNIIGDETMEENKNALDELNKGTTMGMDAIKYILDIVEAKDFKRVLKEQYNEYNEISEKANELYEEYSEKEPHETSTMEKAMTWSSIKMQTMNDKSNSKIAEMLLQGTNMGIIEGRKILNNKKLDKKIHKLIEEFVTMQEEYVEKLKEFL